MVIFSKLIPTTPTFNKHTNSTIMLPINNIDTYFLVDSNVRSLMFLFTIYFPSDNLSMSCLIGIDFLPTGLIIPGIMDFKVFVPNIYSSNGLILTDSIRMIIVILFLVFMILNYIERAKTEDIDKNSFDII
jgi:hypothetical protein